MINGFLKYLPAAAVCAAIAIPVASAQATTTASAQYALSAFAGVTGTYTGFDGKNPAITAGVDLGFRSFAGLKPFLEVRGTYPVDVGSGSVAEKNVLFGPVVQKRFGRLTPYADFLVGRGAIDYPVNFIFNGFVYVVSDSTIYSPGGGVNYALSPALALKADVQFQHWDTPTASGSSYAKAGTIGVQYRFGLGAPRGRR